MPPQVAGKAPVKARVAPAVSPLVLRSRVPLLVMLPAIVSAWPVWVPLAALCKMAPGAMVVLRPTLRVRAVVGSNWRMPEVP